MRYLFFGLMFEEKDEQQLLALSKTSIQQQANCYQLNFISGFETALQQKIDILATVPIGAYPKNSRSDKIRSTDFDAGEHIDYIGFRNRSFYRNIDRIKGYYAKACEYIERSEEPCTLIIYSLYLPFLQVNKKLRKKYSDKIKTVLIVPDLVGKYGIAPRDFLRKILYAIQSSQQLHLQKKADLYVLLTESMKEPLQIRDKPYVIIEGFAPQIEAIPMPEYRKKRIILYTGVLSHETGIDDLLEAFARINDPNCCLYIAGSGTDVSHVVRAAELDPRIQFFGYVNREKIRELQEVCSVVVNARMDSGEYTKYSFPSKTMEYLNTGRTVVMHKLCGIPDEYSPYLFLTKEQTVEGLRNALEAACALSQKEVETRGERTRAWLLANKTPEKQCEKLEKCLKIL